MVAISPSSSINTSDSSLPFPPLKSNGFLGIPRSPANFLRKVRKVAPRRGAQTVPQPPASLGAQGARGGWGQAGACSSSPAQRACALREGRPKEPVTQGRTLWGVALGLATQIRQPGIRPGGAAAQAGQGAAGWSGMMLRR